MSLVKISCNCGLERRCSEKLTAVRLQNNLIAIVFRKVGNMLKWQRHIGRKRGIDPFKAGRDMELFAKIVLVGGEELAILERESRGCVVLTAPKDFGIDTKV